MRGESNLGDFIISAKKLRADMERAKSKPQPEKDKDKKGFKFKQENTQEKR